MAGETGLDELDRLRLLNQIFQTLNQSVNLREALDAALAQTVALLGLETGWIFLYGETDDRFTVAATENLPPGMVYPGPVWVGNCNCQRRFRSGGLSAAVNEVKCSRLAEARELRTETRGLQVHASVPLRGGQRLVGILNVASRSWERFSPTDLELLGAIGEQMGVTIERAQLYERLKAQRVSEQAALLRLSQTLLTTELNLDAVNEQVAAVTREVLRADAAAVILMEGQNRYVLAEQGLPDSCCEVRLLESLGQEGGLAYTLSRGFPISSPDLREERRFEVPEALIEAGILAALRAPLIAEGAPLGMLVAYCKEPRRFSEQEHRLLSLIANQAAIAISKARFYEASLARERLLREVEVARSIQSSLLPDAPPELPGWRIATYWRPASTVAGDFYDFLPLRNGRLGILIADVSDKGMPAALFMAMSRSVVRSMAFSRRRDFPSQSLIKANKLIRADSRADMFVTLFYGILDPESGEFRYTNAGHVPPIWLHAGGGLSVLWQPGHHWPLGIFPTVPLTDQVVRIAPGDRLLFYTDGATDALSDGAVEGQSRLARHFADLAHLPVNELVGELVRRLHPPEQEEAADDIALVVLEREPVD